MDLALLPDDRTVTMALTLAGRAPSLTNVQPWRWRISDRGVDLLIDSERAPSGTDQDSRKTVISCGIALHHLCVAFAASGWAAVVRRFPDPAHPDLFASVRLVPHRTTKHQASLGDAITARRTDRRPYACRPMPPGYLSLFVERAAAMGAQLRRVPEADQQRIVAAVGGGESTAALWGEPGSHKPVLATHGFAGVEPVEPRDHAELFVCGTPGDDRLSRLRAGEATSAVLLTATNIGLATSLLSRPLGPRRAAIRTEVFGGTVVPQVLLRVGWAPDEGEPLPASSRGRVEDLMLP